MNDSPRADLRQPVREHQLGLVAGRRADLEQPVHVTRPDEDVEVLGGPVDPGLVHERKRPADQERHLRSGEHFHRLAVERPGGRVDQRLRGRERHPVSSCRNPLYRRPRSAGCAEITAATLRPALIGAMTKTPGAVRVAAVGDLHFGRADGPPLRPALRPVAEEADVLALCGDLTDTGEPEEARALARVLATAKIPIGRGARQPRFRIRQGGRGQPDPVRRGRARARRQQLRDLRGRLRGGEGVRRRVRAAGAGAVG